MNLALTRFLAYCTHECGYSPRTIEAYRTDLEKCSGFLGKELHQLDAEDIRQFLSSFPDSAAPATIRRKYYALAGFFGFAVDDGLTAHNPMRHVKAPKLRRRLVQGITPEEMLRLLLHRTATLHPRTRAIVLMAYGSGLRVSELATLQLNNLDLQRGVITVRQGKGGKDRLVPMNPLEIAALQNWLTMRRKKGSECGNVFVSTKGKPITRQAIFKSFQKASLAAIGRTASPHKFRHAFCTGLIDGGADLRVVQEMLGHSSISTTQIYLDSSAKRLITLYQNFHPRGENPCEPLKDS